MTTYSFILAGESHGQRSLVDYSPEGHKESDTTECTHMTLNYRAEQPAKTSGEAFGSQSSISDTSLRYL